MRHTQITELSTACIRTYKPTLIHYVHICVCAYIYIYTYMHRVEIDYTYTYNMCRYIHIYTHTYTHKHIHTRINTIQIHTSILMHHKYTHVIYIDHTHIHTYRS